MEINIKKLIEEEKREFLSDVLEKPKSKRLSRIISIESPKAFKESIKELKKGGITRKELRALSAAKGAATLQTFRKNLSKKEMKEFQAIRKIKLPKITKK